MKLKKDNLYVFDGAVYKVLVVCTDVERGSGVCFTQDLIPEVESRYEDLGKSPHR